MKPREVFIFSLLFLLASAYAVGVVVQSMTDIRLQAPALASLIHRSPSVQVTGDCSNLKPIVGLSASSSPELQKLAEYQEVCHSFVTDQMMIFGDMPKDSVDAKHRADIMATKLKEFKKHGVHPLVIIEPSSDWGLVDFTEFSSGFYTPFIQTYFAELKAQGLTDADMGTWVPFPEANLPYWNNQSATPATYATDVNIYLRALRAQFPKTRTSIMLNSATYDSSDFNWANGEYVSLLPYVKGIDKGLVTSFGLQGFPWLPNAKQTGPGIVDAAQYLGYDIASEAADSLGTKEIWYNTGSFHSKYTLDASNTITVPPAKRADILNGILAQANKLKKNGYSVTINIFAQDKSGVTEATDWSYWNSDTIITSPDSPVFTSFVRSTNQSGIKLSLFDIAHSSGNTGNQ
ncbi:MAG: hypothetical protein WCO52_01985 [bacterium]